MPDRNLNPTPEALAAKAIWGHEYGPQSLGCVDWYDTLSYSRKCQARDLAQRIIAAGKRHGEPLDRKLKKDR